MNVRTRFAPSPTGYLHLGGARTALFNWLFAKKHGGTFVLRVEDTDKERNTDEATKAIFEGMDWLGLSWDEGPQQGGDHGPYFQSQRDELYDTYFQKLVDADRVYEDDGAWRFRFDRKPIVMNDLVCGEVTIDYTNEENTPDMVVKRSDGSYVFHFVNVVDDLEMKISHVIRGEDHLMNTPKHLQLFEAFGATPPQYAHIPLILNDDGSKMSKRDTGAAMKEYPEKGFLSEAVFNFIALLGWNPKTEEELFSIAELVEKFSLENVNRSPARFDWDKAVWMNQQHLLKLEEEEFVTLAKSTLSEEALTFPPISTALASIQEKVSLLLEIPTAVEFYHNSDYPFAPEAVEKVKGNDQAIELLSALKDNWATLENWEEAKDQIKTVAKAAGAKPGKLMFPLRVALSGKAGGPDLGAIISILGQEECVRRLDRAVEVIG